MDLPLTSLSKGQIWEQTIQKFSRVTDRLGMPIDAGILETVVALNVLDIITTGSCEGHLDRVYAPYVHFNSNWLREDDRQASEKLQEASEQRRLKQLPPDKIKQIYEEGHQLQAEVRRKHIQAFSLLMPYLAAFYADRHVPYDRRLVLHDGKGILSMLENQGAQFQIGEKPERRQEKLQEYQQEMQAFGAFLKQLYFSSEDKNAG